MSTPEKTLRSAAELASAGFVPTRDVAALEAVGEKYAIALSPAMAGLIERGDAGDPIARQFIPDVRELEVGAGERSDPIGDRVHEKVPGLIHRYPDRVLLKVTHACPVYCRFCFRREVVGPGGDSPLVGNALERAAQYIEKQPQLREVILTGGDPLILSARRVAEIGERLGMIAHLDILRWHTRVPVVAPERMTGDVIDALAAPAKAVYVAIHANHPRELTTAARDAIGRLHAAGVGLISQTVLLKGVNDDVGTLEALFRAFVALKIRPYYLHQADLAPGTAHFRTTVGEGQALMRALRGRISGLALPTYILDVPGGFGKVPAGPAYIDAEGGRVVDVHGGSHAYGAPCATGAATS